MGHGERDAEDGVGAEVLLVGRAVQGRHLRVDEALLARVEADEPRVDLLDDRVDGLLDALAEVAALVAVPALGRLEGARGGAGRDGRTGERAVVEADLDLDGGVAARVQDLAGANLLNAGHLALQCSLARASAAVRADASTGTHGLAHPIAVERAHDASRYRPQPSRWVLHGPPATRQPPGSWS